MEIKDVIKIYITFGLLIQNLIWSSYYDVGNAYIYF